MKSSIYSFCLGFFLLNLISIFIVYSYPRFYHIFPLDDTYIHLVYAKNLAEGWGFSFNQGEPSLGTTSPLWVIILSFFFRGGLNIYYATISFSILLFIGCGLLVSLIARELLKNCFREDDKVILPISLWGGALYLLNGNLHWHLYSGMETQLLHFLSLLSIYLYQKKGMKVQTGFTLGLLLLTRITEATLIFAVLLLDLLQKRKSYSGYLTAILVYLPYLILSYLITGNLIPTTARGKTLTWVDGEFRPARTVSFLLACLKYLCFYNPQIFLLVLFTLAIFAFKLYKWVKAGKLDLLTKLKQSPLLFLILLWGAFHVGIYAFAFRTLAHHLRYISGVFPVSILLSGYAFAAVIAKWRLIQKRVLSALMVVTIVITIWNLSYWKEVYWGNIEQIERVYIKAGEWIKRNTSPKDRIAAFDIGIIKYISRREIIDLGGLVNPEVYPYLLIQNCGEYLRVKRADYIMYSCSPDCDIFTGIYKAEYGEKKMLKQREVISFRTDYYSTPTILHSFELKIYKIEGWLPRNLEGVQKQFVIDKANCEFPLNVYFESGIEFLGYDLDKPVLPVVRGVAQAIYLTYYWRKTIPNDSQLFVRTTFSNPRTHHLIVERYHNITLGIYPMYIWKTGEIIRERHLIWIPDDTLPGEYEIRINLVKDYPIEGIRWGEQGIDTALMDMFGRYSLEFPKDESIKKDLLVGKFKVLPSVLKPIKFKYKKIRR